MRTALLMLLLSGPALAGPSVSFELSLSSPAVLLGGGFDIRGSARIPKGSSLSLDLAAQTTGPAAPFASGDGPRSGDGGARAAAGLGPFEILGVSAGEAREEGDSSVIPLSIKAAAFELGPLVFPALRWTLKAAGGSPDQVQSPPVRLVVIPPESARQEGADLRDIKSPLSPALWPWLLSGLLLFCAAALALLRLSKRKAAGSPGAPASPVDGRPPHRIALDELDALPGLGLSVKEFYDRLSDILRAYLERSLGVSALQMTTCDLQKSLARTPLDPMLRGRVKSLLDRCDLAKFARLLPAQGESLRDVAQAKAIVLAALPAPAPAAEPPASDGVPKR